MNKAKSERTCFILNKDPGSQCDLRQTRYFIVVKPESEVAICYPQPCLFVLPVQAISVYGAPHSSAYVFKTCSRQTVLVFILLSRLFHSLDSTIVPTSVLILSIFLRVVPFLALFHVSFFSFLPECLQFKVRKRPRVRGFTSKWKTSLVV